MTTIAKNRLEGSERPKTVSERLNTILDEATKFDPEGNAYVDKTEVHQATLSLIKEVGLEVIGEDEGKNVTQESYRDTGGGLKVRTVRTWLPETKKRNELRAQQRSRLAGILRENIE